MVILNVIKYCFLQYSFIKNVFDLFIKYSGSFRLDLMDEYFFAFNFKSILKAIKIKV